MPDPATSVSDGPFESERDAMNHPDVRAIHEAFGRDPGAGNMAPHIHRMLCEALAGAGVELGAFDDRVVGWLSGWEPHVVKAIAAMITRAHQAGQQSAVAIDMHRWYATVTLGGAPFGVIGVQTGGDGLGLYDSKEEWEQANG